MVYYMISLSKDENKFGEMGMKCPHAGSAESSHSSKKAQFHQNQAIAQRNTFNLDNTKFKPTQFTI
ncbi:hypothetical protein Hdeb2414_s0013g00416941 [Helianthus debilis subsp. tardiflorus]